MKILHADDHPTFRSGLGYVLEDLSDTIEMLEARDLEEALICLQQHREIHLIILDLTMPGMNGLQGYYKVKQLAHCPIVIISASEHHQDVRQAYEAGIQAYFTKSATRDSLLTGLNAVLRGERCFPQHLLALSTTEQSLLSPRQREVLVLLNKGYSNKDIAQALGITESTTKSHVRAILKALNARTRLYAVMKARELRLI